jgi:Flp pilus assembly protein TadG
MARRSARAQSMVEFAMVVPLFLLLLFAIIDFSRLIFTYVSLTNGARELARNLAISTSTADSSSAAFNNLTLIAGGTQPATSVTVTFSAGGRSGPVTCARNNAVLCSITLTTDASGNVAVQAQPGGALASFSATTSGSVGISATGDGDFVTEAWVATDGKGWPQAYVQVCQLPLSAACGLPSFATGAVPPRPATPQGWFSNGSVQVNLGYTFQFNPLFQNRLAGIVDVSFMRPSTFVTTSVRSYAE